MSKITNREIAKLAGVSPSAVSIAINGKKGISEDTRTKILTIARQYNYFTGSDSVKVVQKRSTYIAALFRTDTLLKDQVFYTEMLDFAMPLCRNLGLTLVTTFMSVNDSSLELPQAISNGDVDGVLIFGDQNPRIYTELNHLGVPFVILDSCQTDSAYPSIFVDYSRAAYLATRYLLDLGHRDIVYLSNGSLHAFNNLILDGFQKATSECDITLYPNRFQLNIEDEKSIRTCLERALSGPCMPTAIFCSVDYYSLRVMRVLNAMGLRIPDDISIVSIDDINVTQLITPALSTVHINREEMLQNGIDMLLSMIKGKSVSSQKLSAPELRVRETTKRANIPEHL